MVFFDARDALFLIAGILAGVGFSYFMLWI